ncbi:MAG: bifunctional diaminohydroxyphosphoribosylaminopyrimidine deaminase/5-amino-6-(5-phosphoribosylamino)uracil reductase RibD [Chromatiales bacterium]|jgi:diaminohydroxyphosphoribosylaminopyrimidine deaminase/5-amino-6-(5-phosphoribosylamino)uracil reductase|nr:bifunctional diaminohydroxyphosphoribosylaminopyrimidine deaminase/5-amino-6-(5-phosphoribosylamino)uracil reductase RibD [Chromatiales bacterium]
MTDSDDRRFMARALELAARGLYSTHPNPRVGCVLVRAGEIVGEGWHERAGEAHAEVAALRAAGAAAHGATAYVTLEPCQHHGRTPPCVDALLRAGVTRVVAAMEDPDPRNAGAGLAALRAASVQVESGLLAVQAEALNPGFIMRHRGGRPFVRCKLGMTLDGRTATATGESRWITGVAARRDVQRLRARSAAIMTGIGTVLADDPSLTIRLDEIDLDQAQAAPTHQPLRVVLDSALHMPHDARLLSQLGNTLIVSAGASNALEFVSRRGVEVLACASADGRIDLRALLAILAEREINELLLEAGPTLSGAMLQAGLIDELVLYVAPKLLGDNARGLFALPGLNRLAQAPALEVTDMRAVGDDWRITATVARDC